MENDLTFEQKQKIDRLGERAYTPSSDSNKWRFELYAEIQALVDKEVTKARQDELKKALDVKFYLPTKVITYLEDRLAQLKENQNG